MYLRAITPERNRYRSQHELVFLFKNGSAPHINNVQLGKYGRNRTNVWSYSGVNSLKPERLGAVPLFLIVEAEREMLSDLGSRNVFQFGCILLSCIESKWP